MNRKVLLIIIGIGIVLGGVFFFRVTSVSQSSQKNLPQEAPVSKNNIIVQNFSFSSQTITVKVGDSVTWLNQDPVAHSATADDGSFDTGIIQKGDSKTITFSKAGTFTYHCTPHPYMKATVIVQ